VRVLLIHQVFASPQSPGGTRHFELARAAMNRGHNFMVIASDLQYTTGKRVVAEKRLVTEETIEGISVARVYTYPSLNKGFVWRVVSFLSFMVTSFLVGVRQRDVDVVMGTTPPIFQTVSAWLIAAIRRKPFLLEVRDLWPEFAIDIGVLTNPTLIWLSRKLESFLYARATHLLVNSPAYCEYLIGKGVAPAKVSLIANGVDPEMFDPNADGASLRAKWAQPGQFVATYAGAMGMANDLPTVLRAAKLLQDFPNIRFWMVGDGKDRPELEKLASELGLQNVTFTGSVSKTEMKNVLAASNACIATLKDIPMFRTTYPNKVFDYMASGRPTVLGIDGVIRAVIEDAEGGIYVQPGSPDALAAAVLALSRNPEAAQRMGCNARSYVVTHFNRHDQAAAFADLISRVGHNP
jgi:glycosyltransferase involved in cell wall biosynthesis